MTEVSQTNKEQTIKPVQSTPYKNRHFMEPAELPIETKKDEELEDNSQAETPEEKTFKKRYGDLRTFHTKTVTELKKEIDGLKSTLATTQAEGYKPPADEKELEEWVKKYPQVAGFVETIAHKRVSEQEKAIKAKLDEAETRLLEMAQDRAMAKIENKHPDFVTLRESEEFHAWAEAQPKHIQDWLYDNYDNPDLVIRAVDLYKLDAGITATQAASKKRSEKREAAASVNVKEQVDPNADNRGKKTWKESEIARMTPRQYEKYEAEIDLARSEGRFEFDLSKR